MGALENWLQVDTTHAPTCPVYHPTSDLRYPLCVCGIEALREKARAELISLLTTRAQHEQLQTVHDETAKKLTRYEMVMCGRQHRVNHDGTVTLEFESEKVGRLFERLDNARADAGRMREALTALMARLDDHFGGDPRNDWKEQAQARAALSERDGGAGKEGKQC